MECSRREASLHVYASIDHAAVSVEGGRAEGCFNLRRKHREFC